MIRHSLLLFFFVTTGLLSGQILFAQIKDDQVLANDHFSSSPQASENNDLKRRTLDENSQRVLATVTVIFENGETEFYENVENEFIEALENVLNVLPGSPEESTIPVTIVENGESNVSESELTENVISELANNNEGLTEEAVLINEGEIQTPSEEFGEVSQGGEIIFGEEGVVSTESSETISTSEEISSVLESENEIISEVAEVIINEEQPPEIVIIGENTENIGEISLPEEIIFSETEIPSNESGEFIQEEVGLPNNEEFGGNLETESQEILNEELIGTIGEENESSLPEETEFIQEGEIENLAEGEVSISEETESFEGLNEEVAELEGVVIIGEGENTEFTEENGEVTELEGIVIIGEENEIPEFTEENAEITELEGVIIIGEGEGEMTEFTEESGEITEFEEGIIIIGEGETTEFPEEIAELEGIPEFNEENAEITEFEEGIIIIGEEGEISEFTEENGEVTELEGIPEFTEGNGEITELEEGIIIIGEEGEISEITEFEEGIIIGEGETTEFPEEENLEITELEEGIIIIGEGETPGEHFNESELTEGELVIIEVPEGPEIIIIGGNGTGEVIIEEVGEETILIIETGEGEVVITEAEVIYGEGGEIIIILPIENWEENPTEIIVITGPGEFEVPNEQTTPPIPVETIIEVSETIIWSESTTIISETIIIETNITEYVIIILETGFGSGSESIEEEIPIIIVEEGEGSSESPVIEEQIYETVPINYEAPVDLNFSVGTQVISIQGGGGGNIDIDLGNSGSEENLEESNNQNTTSGSGSTTWPGWPGWTGGSGWSSEPVPEQLGELEELTNWDIQVNTQARSVIQLAPGAQELQTASVISGDFTEVISQVSIEIDDQLFFIDSLYLIRPNYNNIGLAPIIVQAAPKRCQQIESCETITMPGVGPQNRCKNHLICE